MGETICEDDGKMKLTSKERIYLGNAITYYHNKRVDLNLETHGLDVVMSIMDKLNFTDLKDDK